MIVTCLSHDHDILFVNQEVRPTVFVGVPRVWEKFKDKIDGTLREVSGIKETIMTKARVSPFLFFIQSFGLVDQGPSGLRRPGSNGPLSSLIICLSFRG